MQTHYQSRRSATIVVADDESALTEILARRLSRDGFHVFTACDGDEALRSALDHRPDVVLTDLKMPNKTGAELCEELKARPETRGILVIIMSSLPRWSIPDCGADGYIAKPFSFREVAERVRTSLSLRS